MRLFSIVRQSWKNNNTCYFCCEISGNFVANLSTVQLLLIRQSSSQHNLKYFRTLSLWLGSKISWSGFIYLDHLRYMSYIKVQTATFTNFWINKSPLFNLIVNLFCSLIRSQRLVIENILQAFDPFRLFCVFLSLTMPQILVKALNKGYLFSVVPEFCTSVFVILSGATCKNKCFFAIITYFPSVRLLVNVYQLYDKHWIESSHTVTNLRNIRHPTPKLSARDQVRNLSKEPVVR